MSLKELLSTARDARGNTGMIGAQTEWLPLSEFALRGGRLQMVEKRIVGQDGSDAVSIAATPGAYLVECRVMVYDTDKRISRMRVSPTGTEVERGQQIGEIAVDLGGVAITDMEVLVPSVEKNWDDYMDWIEEVSFGGEYESVGVLKWEPADTESPFADGGFGDGAYPVYEVISDGRAVGLEVEFIAEGTPYPFGQD